MLATTGVLDHIRTVSGCFAVEQVTEYRGHRIRKDGAHQEFTIRIYDLGVEEEHPRFHAEVEAEDGVHCTGTPAHTLEGALKKVPWSELD